MKTKTSQKNTSKLQSHPEHVNLAEQPKQASASTASTSTTGGTVSTTSTSTTPPPWRGVFFFGPESVQNRDGDEIPVWHVFVGDDQGEPVGRVYRTYSYDKAETLANKMSHDRQLELIAEANQA